MSTTETVSVVVATRDREELLATTLAAILDQDHPGTLEVLLVYDQAEPRHHHARDEHPGAAGPRSVRVLVNDERSPGLAGARNTGILAATGALVAFCDDDDVWRPDKLRRQLDAIAAAEPGGHVVACATGILVHYDGARHERVPELDEVSVADLTRSRVTGVHPSSYVIRRDALVGIGMVDEDLPGGYGEDYDLMLRLAAVGRVLLVRAALVDVLWHRGSYFTAKWQSIHDGLAYLVDKHPQIAADKDGRARILGQQAFALAAMGRRRDAMALAWQALRRNPLEQRVPVAALVAARVVSADRVMHEANRRGRGI